MASACFIARCVSVPAHLLAHRTPLAITSCRLRRHGAAGARSVCAAGRMLGSVRYGTGAGLGSKQADAEVAAVPPSVPVRVAYELQLAGHRYLDVRTEGEFGCGHPAGAVNIPYMHSTGSGRMAKNSRFLEQVSVIFRRDDEFIIGCQSGRRSLLAATELCSAGFTAVTDIAGGFSAWRENGLPIKQ
ncbi:senescence-associated protein [Hordeum vulgare]|nr:senescence-associated protein [Hordeum vulgare]